MSESILQPPSQPLSENSPMVDAFPIDPNFKPGGEMVTIMGAPEGDTVRTMTEAPGGLSFLAPTQNITREYIPLSSEFDPYAYGAGSYSPLFFRNIASRTGPTTSAVVSSAGSGDGDWISSLLAPGTPGAGAPSTGNISRDFEAISNTPGLLNALLSLASGPVGIASVAAGSLLSNVMGREQVATLGEAIKNALMDRTMSAEDRARLQETQRGLNRVQELLGLDRVGVTREQLPTLSNVSNISSTANPNVTTLTTDGSTTSNVSNVNNNNNNVSTTSNNNNNNVVTTSNNNNNVVTTSNNNNNNNNVVTTTDTGNEALRTLINSIYSNELGRTLGTSAEDQAGLQYWLGQAANKTPEELARDIRSGAQGQDITSVQNRQEVRDLYEQLFNRAADTEGLNYWAQQAATKSDEELRRDILSGASAADRAEYENRQEVRDLYQNLFGRPADEGGLDYWSQQAATKSPEELARDMLSGASETDRAAYTSKTLNTLFYPGVSDGNSGDGLGSDVGGFGSLGASLATEVAEGRMTAAEALDAMTGAVAAATGLSKAEVTEQAQAAVNSMVGNVPSLAEAIASMLADPQTPNLDALTADKNAPSDDDDNDPGDPGGGGKGDPGDPGGGGDDSGGEGGGGNCFVAGTPVLMSDGSTKLIEDIEVGDAVATWKEGGPVEAGVVKALIRGDTDELMEISYQDKTIRCTPAHRFHTPNGWVEAANLKGGDTVFDGKGESIKIGNVKYFKWNGPVFNLTMGPFPHYVANGLRVHNEKHEGGLIGLGEYPRTGDKYKGRSEVMVPALEGEFVINPEATRKYGIEFLQALNQGRLPAPSKREEYAQGGVIPLLGGGKIARGPGGGLDDLIPTTIDGKRAAALSDGEFVIPADVVSMMGDGSTNAGSKRLYDLVRQIRENKTGTSRQAGPLPIGDILKRSLG